MEGQSVLPANLALDTIISTDFEPDDAAAILLYLSKAQCKRVLFVVGEDNDPHAKCLALCSLIKQQIPNVLDRFDIECVPGTMTARTFPTITAITQDVRYFCLCIRCDPARSVIAEFIKNSPNRRCNVLSIKPPRDLLDVLAEDASIFSNCHLFAYGSYNIRCVLGADVNLDSLRNFYNTAFRSTLLHERRYSLATNGSLCKQDGVTFAKPLEALVTQWNECITKRMRHEIELQAPNDVHYLQSIEADDFMDSINHLRDSQSELYDSLEVMHRVTVNKECNMVLADVGLVACMLSDNVPTAEHYLDWHRDSRYTELKPKESLCNVHVVYTKDVSEMNNLRALIVNTIRSCVPLLAAVDTSM